MRFMGALMLFLCCTGGGLWLSARLTGRVNSLGRAERMLTEMIGMVHNQNLPTGEILARLKQEGYLPREAENVPEALEAFAADPLFRPAERVILVRTGQILGSSDRESQTARLELELSSLRRILAQSQEEKAVRGKLFRTMGLLLGALAVVLAI